MPNLNFAELIVFKIKKMIIKRKPEVKEECSHVLGDNPACNKSASPE